jgi:hypothetical protein
MKKIVLLTFTLGCFLALSAQETQPVFDPWVGTWTLDPSQSQFQGPAPQRETLQIQSVNQGPIRYTTSGTDAQGKPMLESFDGKSDGQSYPISVNGYEGGRMALTRVSDREYTGQGTLADGTPVTQRITLSPDGRTITVQSQGKSNQGAFNNTAVFVKQQ